MTNDTRASWIRAVAYAVAVTALSLTVLIVAAEEIAPLKAWLKQTFYHHWLGKGALSIALFAIVTLALRKRRNGTSLATVVAIETIAVLLAAAMVAGFFLLHTLKVV